MTVEEKLKQIARVDLSKQITGLEPSQGVPDAAKLLYARAFEKEKLELIKRFRDEAKELLGIEG